MGTTVQRYFKPTKPRLCLSRPLGTRFAGQVRATSRTWSVQSPSPCQASGRAEALLTVELKGPTVNRRDPWGLILTRNGPISQETLVTSHPTRCLLVLVAALSLQLTGCSDDSPHAIGPSTDTPSADQSTASEPPSSETTASSPVSLREYQGSITPGRHRVPLISWNRTYPVDALVQVPNGFVTPGGWVIENNENGAAYGDLMFWGDVDLVDTDPCGAGRMVKPGPTVRDLADALANRLHHRATTPKPVTVGGYRGLYVEMRVPRSLSRCESEEFTVFEVNQSDESWYSAGPGRLLRFWIVDVHGQRVAVAVNVVPGRTTHAAEIVRMAQTAEFVDNAS
jgi:hypothetical protein